MSSYGVGMAHGRTTIARGVNGRAVAVVLAAVAVEGVAALAIVDARFHLLLLPLVGAIGTALVFTFPIGSVIAAVVVAATVFYDARFTLPAGPVAVHTSEALLGALLLVAVMRPARRWWGGAAGAALAVFFALLVLSTALAVTAGRVRLFDAIDWARGFAPLAFFFVIVRLLPGPVHVRRLLTVLAALGALTGAVSLLVALAPATQSFFQDPAGQIVSSEAGPGSLARIRFPGLAPGYVMFWVIVVMAFNARGAQRAWWILALLADTAGIAVSLNRNMWLGLLFGVIVIAVVGRPRLRGQFAAVLAVAAAAGAVLLIAEPGIGKEPAVQPVAARATTLLHPVQTFHQRSLQDRVSENRRAWEAVQGDLLTGVGPGVPWGSYYLADTPRGMVLAQQLFLHNQYLYAVLVAGLPGLIGLALFLALTLRAAWMRAMPDLAVRAAGVGIAMAMLSAFVMISFSVRNWTITIGVVAGAILLAARDDAEPLGGPAT